MPYTINLGAWNGVFALPCAVVDEHLKLVGRNALKVLLYLLRHAGETPDEAAIAAATGVEPEDIPDAVAYWVHAGLLCACADTLTPPPAEALPAQAPPPATPATSAIQAPSVQQAAPPVQVYAAPQQERIKTVSALPPRPTPGEVAQFSDSCADIRHLLEGAQGIFGRDLSMGEVTSLVWLVKSCGVCCEVLLLVLEYCRVCGKLNQRYIEKVALDFCDSGIDTLEKADARVKGMLEGQRNEEKIKTAFGISGRSLSSNQRAYVERWLGEMHLPMETIRMAYDKTVDAINKVSFAYIDRILTSWQEQGGPDAGRAGAAPQRAERSYDIAQYERESLARLLGTPPDAAPAEKEGNR